ncbi:MAG: hypothetical protein FWC19_03255 [Treponema sp.]|nr:hypothetical protein [Treponema sp.]MCL2271808.1 hypothetical protein [Treponema sp.]
MLSNNRFLIFAVVLFLFLCSAAQVFAVFSPDTEVINKNLPLFPHMLFTDTINSWKAAEFSKPYWVHTKEELEDIGRQAENQVSLLLNYDILAYYGHPNSRNMGILGRYTMEELDEKLTALAVEYEEAGGKKIKKAFYIIYGTVWPRGDIGILREDRLLPYIEYGLENDFLVFIDHQIGRYDPIDSLKRILPWLKYPNVHLALDPEWRTDKPMEDFGYMTGEEINTAQRVMEDYIIENDIPGERMLVIHQFNRHMILNRQTVNTDFDRVRLVHCMDGIGSPAMKKDTYAFNALAANMPIKGFKLFYDFGIPGAGVDKPLMSPSDVYALNPRPVVIMYQ